MRFAVTAPAISYSTRYKLSILFVERVRSALFAVKKAHGHILPGVVHDKTGTAGVFRQPFSDVVYLSVQYHPAICPLLVLRHLLPRVRGQRLIRSLWRRHDPAPSSFSRRGTLNAIYFRTNHFIRMRISCFARDHHVTLIVLVYGGETEVYGKMSGHKSAPVAS